MITPRSNLFSALCHIALVGVAALPLAGQQRVCLSLHQGPATGQNSLGLPAQVAARVQGVHVTVPTTNGMTAAAASAAHEAAFQAAGFTTERETPHQFCLTSAPGNLPITSGLCYGTDDLGLDLDSSVAAVAPPPAADPKTKDAGVVVPLPGAQQPPQPFGGVVVIMVRVRIGSQYQWIVIQIVLPPNWNGQQLRLLILQQLLAHGLLGNVIVVPDPLQPNQRIEVLQVERTVAGWPVVGVEYAYDAAARRLLRSVTGAGLESLFGGYEYGWTQPTYGMEPWSHLGGQPRIGSFFDVFHELGWPSALGGFVLGTSKTGVPVFQGNLLVDPEIVELALTSASGRLTRTWSVPGSPSLVGFPLHSQGFVLAGNGDIALSTGVAANIAP